jgi:hypothetical protein
MSRAEIVDSEYRLHATDLTTGDQIVTITAISLQGLEEAQPVAHFAETRKRLPLDESHCRTLILLTGSTLFSDWVGYSIRLRLDPAYPHRGILILPPRAPFSWSHLVVRWNFLWRWRQWATQPNPATASSSLSTSGRRAASSFWRLLSHDMAWQESWRPLLAILLLAVVTFFYARAYGHEWVAMWTALLSGNGG